jgi:hypothetical protein
MLVIGTPLKLVGLNSVLKMTSMNPTKTGGIEPSVKDDEQEPH